eukprot:TRINITY_DN5006_c0_g1::TRINITY_DN5006_c0_g1_i1::g.24885::m.24885 TRINITY_DN5006_c0_g1::TRINITY_DN5006_c0_g1_i1::g.24885  ORF type:complete len:124 (-),score=-8.74,sp/P39724/BOL3_YEAST/53.62/4e-20,BolA/PF01722.13/3.4e-18 TRINITY_DN5006_c0_g1_i1:177-548(-)
MGPWSRNSKSIRSKGMSRLLSLFSRVNSPNFASYQLSRSAFLNCRFHSSGEAQIAEKLKTTLQPSTLLVEDMSGGCGTMFSITIESPLFKGKSLVAQHRMVNEILKDDIKKWHGLTLKTAAPK